MSFYVFGVPFVLPNPKIFIQDDRAIKIVNGLAWP